VLENRVLRRIFGLKRDKEAGKWRRVNSEEFNGQYCVSDKIAKNEMGGACSTYGGERRFAYRVLVWKPEGNRPLGTSRLSSSIYIYTSIYIYI
jgi:hypothetical protein